MTLARTAIGDALDRAPVLLPLLLYLAFAAAVYAINGPEPSLGIDHISYFKMADEIRAEFPHGDYWRSFNSVRAYGVILAYLIDLTGSHLTSLKLLLAAMTVAYLWAFQVFMGLATESRARAVLFSLFSALFVSFGASIWGMTDFAASLSRTIIIPPVVLLVWFFFREFSSPWRYAVLPALILLSLLHLSALHVFLVFGVFELLDFIFRRRCRVDRDVAYFTLALIGSAVMQVVIDMPASSAIGYVRYTLNMGAASAERALPEPPPPLQPGAAVEAASAAGALPGPQPPLQAGSAVEAASTTQALPGPQPPLQPGSAEQLTNREAWRIELLAFPWRNFPPTLATVATMASSFGVIFLLAVAGALRAFRSGSAKPLDRAMITFASAVLLAAYGLQILLWVLRNVISIIPINFEEIRAINMIMIPSVYFIFRLYDLAPEFGGLSKRAVQILVMVALALQPIILVRALPVPWREGLIDRAVAWDVVRSRDAPRMLYARQFLGLAGNGRRFYYSSRPAAAWLERNAGPNDTVLTNANEFYMSRVKTVGPFLEIVNLDIWDVRRRKWSESLEAIDQSLASKDLGQVMALARSMGATYAIVNWPVENAAYHDAYYSIVRVQ